MGTWNVRGMGIGKLEIVKKEMERVGLDLLGVSELKWSGKGHFSCDGYTMCYSGKNPVTGVGILLSDRMTKSML